MQLPPLADGKTSRYTSFSSVQFDHYIQSSVRTPPAMQFSTRPMGRL